jgi:malate dehydrogenase
VNVEDVENVIIWGNHSSTQFPDVRHATVKIDGKKVKAYDAVQDDTWLTTDFVSVLIHLPYSSAFSSF